jgi:erythromycin esterase
MRDEQDIIPKIASATFPLRTTVPDDDLSDLNALKPCIENHSIIALGESTHGAREFFQVKHRLIRYLVTELDVRVLGFEMGFTGTLPLNAYLLHGEGDPEEILSGFGWLARTESFLELVEWLREFNKSKPRSQQVAIHGIDIGSGIKSIEGIETYLQQVDPEFYSEQSEQFKLLRSYRDWDDKHRDELTEDAGEVESLLRNRFDMCEEEYVAKSSQEDWAHASHQLDIYSQAREYTKLSADEQWVKAREHRDRSMADNVEWTLAYEEAERIVLWAHDGHIRNGRITSSMPNPARTMGWYLNRRHGDEYYALGLEFGKGLFHASPNPDRDDVEGLQEWSIDEPKSDSLPAVLQRVGENQFFLDLEHATEDDCLKDWLSQEQDILSIGGYFYENDIERHYNQSPLFQEFDGLLFVDEVSRAQPLPD